MCFRSCAEDTCKIILLGWGGAESRFLKGKKKKKKAFYMTVSTFFFKFYLKGDVHKRGCQTISLSVQQELDNL